MGRDSGLKVCAGGGMPKIILRITGLLEILGRDYGIKKLYWGPSYLIVWKRLIARCCYDAVCTLVYSLYAFQLSINSFSFSSVVIVICYLKYFSSLQFFLLLTGRLD